MIYAFERGRDDNRNDANTIRHLLLWLTDDTAILVAILFFASPIKAHIDRKNGKEKNVRSIVTRSSSNKGNAFANLFINKEKPIQLIGYVSNIIIGCWESFHSFNDPESSLHLYWISEENKMKRAIIILYSPPETAR